MKERLILTDLEDWQLEQITQLAQGGCASLKGQSFACEGCCLDEGPACSFIVQHGLDENCSCKILEEEKSVIFSRN